MIYVLGSINLDMIATGERLPLPGETLRAHSFATAPGGKGANQALAAARAGAGVKMVGAVGADDFAQRALAELKAAKIDLSDVAVFDVPTGIAIILVDAKGENVIVIVEGANGKIDETAAQNAVAQMAVGDILVMVQEIPASALMSALRAAQKNGIKTILNIAPFIPETISLVKLADIVVANETEFSLLVGQTMSNEAIAQVAADWARQQQKTLIITMGSEGALAVAPEQQIHVPAKKIVAVDSVGAGDTFCGYLAAGLDQGLDLKSSLRQAAVAGSLACLKPGAQPAIPTMDEVKVALNS